MLVPPPPFVLCVSNCRTLLHMHTRTCMCRALLGLRAALVLPHPLSFPGGGGVTWSTQIFLLQLTVLLCGFVTVL